MAWFCYDSAVPNHTKGAGPDNPAKNPPFEEALQKLEGVVEAMESDDLPPKLEKNAAGEMKLQPLDLAEE